MLLKRQSASPPFATKQGTRLYRPEAENAAICSEKPPFETAALSIEPEISQDCGPR